MNFPLDIFQVIGCSLFKLDRKYLMRSLLHWWSCILLTIFSSNKIHWNKIFPPEINCLLSHFMLRSFNQQSSRHVTENFFSSLGRVWDISIYLAGKEFVFLTCHYSLDWIVYPFSHPGIQTSYFLFGVLLRWLRLSGKLALRFCKHCHWCPFPQHEPSVLLFPELSLVLMDLIPHSYKSPEDLA